MNFKNRNVVLKALVGSHNYKLSTPESDKDFKVFVTPTFEEIYRGEMYSYSVIGKTEDLDVHDVRKLTNLFYKSNINFLEILASKELYIAEDAFELKAIYDRRDRVFKMNLPYLYQACKGMYFNKMKYLEKGTEGTKHLVDEFGYDTKQAQHAFRTLNVCERYANNGFTDFVGAITYDGLENDFMREIKSGEMSKYEFIEFVGKYKEEVFDKLEDTFKSQPVDEDMKEFIEASIMSLVRRNIK